MAKSTKNTYKPVKIGNYKSVVRMAEGGNVSELNYSDRKAYIESHYAPFITDAQMIFLIYDSGIEYDYKGDRKEVVNSIIESYKSLADYTEITLPQETIYEIKDWELVRKDIDPETNELVGETPLEELSADNTYNFSYNGLVDLNWRVYEDKEFERYFYVITPHLGGDIRGNYGDAIILQGNNKDELFYRYYQGFISGGASIYLKFKDGSEIGFDSEQDSDVFYFRLNEIFQPTGMAKKYLTDFEKFETWYGDEFLEETIDIYLMRKGIAPKMMAGGSLNDETPMAYIQVLGYNEGQWFNLTDYSDGQDVIDAIYDWMNGLNMQFGGNREEYEVTDYEGFGNDLYDQYMSSNEFDEIIEGYEKYENSDFHSDIITAYRNDSGSRNYSLSEIIDEMDNNFFGKYKSLQDFGYEMVQQGVYEPSDYDVYITDTDKRILAGEESDAVVYEMDFEDLLNVATNTQSEYENEKSELENRLDEINYEIDDLESLKDSTDDDDDEYDYIIEQVEEKELLKEEIENSLQDIDSNFEDRAREEARNIFYDEIYDKLENDLSSWLEEYGYTENLQDISFLSVDYEKIGDEIGGDYLIIEYDGEMYFFSNYSKGGRVMATKQKPKYDYYIVESSTKKLVSGYSTKKEALEQRKLLIEEYPSMRFEIYTLGNLESKTNLDVYAKKDYVQLSTLDKIKKVSVDAFRYGKEKVGQANEFLVRNDVKGKIKRGARNIADKTKQGFNWLRNKWREADFGDGKGEAKFFAGGGGVDDYDYQDIGQFSMPDSEWKNYSQEDFNRIGRKIVKEQFNGDLTRAYDSIVHKRTYFVVSAKNDKVVSRGFDTEEEAKKEMYSMFEKTGDFSYAIKKFVNKGKFENGGLTRGEIKDKIENEILIVYINMYRYNTSVYFKNKEIPVKLYPPKNEFNFIEWAKENNIEFEQWGDTEMIDVSWGYTFEIPFYKYIEYMKTEKLYTGVVTFMAGGTTTTRPTTTPEVVPDTDTKPRKPDRDNPYKPKHIPKPKAKNYDFILVKK